MKAFVFVLTALATLACTSKGNGRSASQVYTLYRSGVIIKHHRGHYATFDAEGESAGYNKENCEKFASLLNYLEDGKNPAANFWCELGPFREN